MKILILALALALPVAAGDVIDEFESPEAGSQWKAEKGTALRVDDLAHDGSGALQWTASEEGGVLSTTRARGDLSECQELRLWMHLKGTVEREFVARFRAKGGMFWRRFSLRPGVWSEIVLPFYQFRRDGCPSWRDVESLEFLARRAASVVLDSVRVREGGTWPAIEPNNALAERVFGDVKHSMAMTENFRVFTDAEVNARDVADRLEAGLVRFRKIFALEEKPLDYPVTLIIRAKDEDYRRTAVDTSRDVYGGVLEPPRSGGYTFWDYSFAGFDAKQGALRPVFLHEACHQLVSRMLGFSGASGATWIEEGICYLVQNEFYPQEDMPKLALELLGNEKRLPLSRMDGELKIAGGDLNLQSYLVVRFLLRGPHADQWGELKTVLHDNGVNLVEAAGDAWGLREADLEKEWEAFTREWAGGK